MTDGPRKYVGVRNSVFFHQTLKSGTEILVLCTASKIRVATVVEGGVPLPGDFRVIVCPTPPQLNGFCDLLGTPDAPVSKIVSVKLKNYHDFPEIENKKARI